MNQMDKNISDALRHNIPTKQRIRDKDNFSRKTSNAFANLHNQRKGTQFLLVRLSNDEQQNQVSLGTRKETKQKANKTENG
jgi:hypothetical protein